MAIAKMKKLRVITMAREKEALLSGLMDLGCVEISAPDGKLQDPDFSALLRRETSRLTEKRTELADVNAALEAIKRYGKTKDGLMIRRKAVSREEFYRGSALEQAKSSVRSINEALQTIARALSDADRIHARQASLLPWESLDLPLQQQGTERTVIRLGVCPAGVDTAAMRNALGAAEAEAELMEVSADRQQTYLLLIFHRAAEQTVQETLRPFNFSAVSFSGLTGTPRENLDRLAAELTRVQEARQQAEARIAAHAEDRDAIRLYADHLNSAAAEDAGAEQLLTNGTILFFEGWVPAKKEAAVTAFLDRLNCAWETADPEAEEYPDVPVKLDNNAVTDPMNMVTEMYSLPAYDGIDPNPVMAPFFILFFGMMLADMGYGLLMIAAGLYITKKYRPKGTMGHMFGISTLCGISTFIWGALTGGFFGDFLPQLLTLINPESTFALPALFTPLNDALPVLIGSLALGVIQIFTGMAISIYKKVKRGQVMDAICGEVAWYAVFLCIALAALTGQWSIFMIAAVVILLLTQGYGKKGIAGKLMGIGGSLYNNITGYFSDILSYSRLMALMLAGAVIAQVFNTLGAITGNIFTFVLISFIGNALNFGLNLLGCYVHDLRLQCLEYFGRFYEDGGKPFQPLAPKTRYVDIVDSF